MRTPPPYEGGGKGEVGEDIFEYSFGFFNDLLIRVNQDLNAKRFNPLFFK